MTKWIQLDSSSPDKEEPIISENHTKAVDNQQQQTRGLKNPVEPQQQQQQPPQQPPYDENVMINPFSGATFESPFRWNKTGTSHYQLGPQLRTPSHQPRLAWPPFQPRQPFKQHDFG